MDPEDAKDLDRYLRDKGKAKAKGKFQEVAQLCNCIGEIYSKYERYEDAIEEHKEEKQMSEVLADKIGEAVACRLIGECYCALGQYQEALEQQKRHLTLARECQNDLEEQRAWATIGRTYLCQAESRNVMESSLANKRAEKAFFRALETCEKVKASVSPSEYMAMKGRLFLNIGLVYDNRGDLKQSADAMKKAVMIAEKYKLDNELQMCQASLATMYQNGGKFTEAIRNYEAALKLAQKLRNKMGERDLLISKAMVHVAIGDFLEAKHCLKKAHKLKLEGNINTDKLRKLFKNVVRLQEAKADLENVEDENQICQLHEVIADCLVDLGNCKEAIASYLRVLCYNHLLSSEKKAAIYTSLAQTYADDREYNSAIFYYKKELDIQKENPEQSCRTNLNIAELEELNGSKYAVVCKVYMEAFEQAKKAKHGKLMIQTLKSLIELQKLCQQKAHLEKSEKTLAAVRKKYGDEEDTEESQEEECSHDVSGKVSEGPGDLSLSELTVSDESDDEENAECGSVIVSRKKKSNFTRTNEKGETPLHRACINGKLKKVKVLIAEGHPLNPRDYCGWLPLHEAANHGYADIVEHLLTHGAWIDDRGGERCGGVTPLIDAANCGNLEVVRVLLSHGANVRAKDDDGNTALDCLQAWYDRAMKVLEASDVLEYKKTEKLLLDSTGKNGPPARKLGSRAAYDISKPASCTTSSHVPVITTTRDNSKDAVQATRVTKLPDLDGLDEDENRKGSTSKSVKAKLAELRQRRIERKSKRSHRNRRHSGESMSSNSDSSDLENLHRPPAVDAIRIENDNATEVYQNAMMSLRTSAQNRVSNNDRSDETRQLDAIKTPYYDGMAFDVEDGWLVNDIAMPKCKKRSAEVNKILTTSGMRTSVSGRVKKRKIHETLSPDENSVDSISSIDINDSGSNQGGKKRNSNPTGKTVTTQPVNGNNSEVITTGDRNILNGGVASSTTQSGECMQSRSDEELWGPDEDYLYDSDLMLGGFHGGDENSVSITRVIPSGDLSELGGVSTNDCDHQIKASTVRESSFNNDQISKPLHVRPENQEMIPKNMSDPPVSKSAKPAMALQVKFSVKVELEGKTFLVPVFAGDENKPTAWLAQQVADRYFSSFLVYPMLTFKSPDGCLISPSDPVCVVTDGISMLQTDVHAWSRRTAVERYEKVCKTFYQEPNATLKSALQKIGRDKVLDLNNFNLDLNQLLPVFRALEGENTLTEVILNGNRLTDSSLDALMKFLASLHSLTDLKLESVELTSEGMQVFASSIQSLSSLQSLSRLSLSYNTLTDKAEPDLKLLLKGLPKLTSLRLTACCLTSQIFTPSLLEAFAGSSLDCLSVSENQLTRTCLKSLFEKLNAESLRELDISQSLQEDAHSFSVESLLQPIASHGLCRLQSLSLAGCHLSREDILAVIRMPVKIPSLQELVISLNTNVTNTSIQKLLSLSTGKGSRLQALTARGCSIRSPLSDEFVEALRGKLRSDVPLSKFVFSCRGLTSAESDLIESVWQQQWQGVGKVKFSGMIVNLAVESLAM